METKMARIIDGCWVVINQENIEIDFDDHTIFLTKSEVEKLLKDFKKAKKVRKDIMKELV